MIPTQRLYILLCLGGALGLLLATLIDLSLGIAGTLTFDTFLFILAIWDGWRARLRRVQVSRMPLQRLSIGRDNPVLISVETKQWPVFILIRDTYPINFTVSTATLTAILPPQTREELSYSIHPDHRGEYQWGNIYLRQLSPWGLVWSQWQTPATETVAVYPDLIGLRALSIRLTLENSGTLRQIRRSGAGTEFAELREYRVGDDTRLIDWKATARRSRPLVRVLEPEKEQTLLILLDRGRLMTTQVQGLKRFDWGLNATLSLALAGLNRGDRVGVAVFDREITTWVAPERGNHQLSKLLETLTPIQPVLLEPDYMSAVTKVVNQQTRRSLVVMITDLIDITASAELLGAMMRLTPRYLPFCVTLRDPEVDQLAHQTLSASGAGEKVTDPQKVLEQAYRRSVALDLLSQRQVAFAQLKQKGVLVLDAPASQISDQLVDRYLQLKARNLL